MLLLVFSVTRGREAAIWDDRGLLLRSVCDRAAGLASASAVGTGAVTLRLLLVVLRLRLPSLLDITSKWAACVALKAGGGRLGSSLWLTPLGDRECVLDLRVVVVGACSSPDVSLEVGTEVRLPACRLRPLFSLLLAESCLALSLCRLLKASAILSLI